MYFNKISDCNEFKIINIIYNQLSQFESKPKLQIPQLHPKFPFQPIPLIEILVELLVVPVRKKWKKMFFCKKIKILIKIISNLIFPPPLRQRHRAVPKIRVVVVEHAAGFEPEFLNFFIFISDFFYQKHQKTPKIKQK